MNNNIKDILKVEGIMSQGFGIAPKIIMRDTRLSIEAKAIYCYLQSFAGSAGSAFPSRETILSELQISKDRYYKYLNQLIEYGYIRVERQETATGWKKGNVYVIVANPEEREKSEAIDPVKNTSVNQKRNIISKPKRTRVSPLFRQLAIGKLKSDFPEDAAAINQIYKVLQDLERSEAVKIGGSVKDRAAIIDILSQLTYKHIIYTLQTINENRDNIKNMRLWIQSCIYNSVYEMSEDVDRKIIKYKNRAAKAATRKKKAVAAIVPEITPASEEAVKIKHRQNELYMLRAKASINGDVISQQKYDAELDSLNREIEALNH